MANQYGSLTAGDWRSSEQVNPQVAQFIQWAKTNPQIQAITADPRYAGNTPAQRRARQAAIHQVVVSAGQHIPEGLKINADGQLETDDETGLPGWAKALIIGGAGAAAFFGGPALLSALGGGGGGAGAAGAGGTAGAAGTTGPVAADVALESAAGISGGTAGGTTAGAAGAATAGAGGAAATKGVSNWLSPLLQYGLPVAGQLGGAQIASTGIKEAAEIQAQSFQKALDYEKERDEYLKGLESQRYSDLTGRLQPYIAIGQTAADRMAALLGLNPSGHGYTPPPPAAGQNTGVLPTTQPSGAPIIHTMPVARTTGMPDQPMPIGTAPMVTMRAPDGTTQVVPATAVDHYRARGAEVVNG